MQRAMDRLSWLFWRMVSLALTIYTIAFVYVAVTDPTDVRSLAQSAACGAQGRCAWSFQEYWVFARNYDFVNGRGQSIRVHCVRSNFLLGDYVCEVPGRSAASAAPSAAPPRQPVAKAPRKPPAAPPASASAPVPAGSAAAGMDAGTPAP